MVLIRNFNDISPFEEVARISNKSQMRYAGSVYRIQCKYLLHLSKANTKNY